MIDGLASKRSTTLIHAIVTFHCAPSTEACILPCTDPPSLLRFFLFSSVFSFLFSLSKTHLLLLHLVPSVLELSIVIDRGDNNDRILLSSKLFLFLFVFGGGIKNIDREDNNEFFRVNYFYEFVFGGEIKIIDGDNNDRILSIKNYFYECFW